MPPEVRRCGQASREGSNERECNVRRRATRDARRTALTAQIQAETGIDEEMIERLVRAFCVRVRADETLGPIFSARIAEWEPHLQKMFAFWSSVALMSGRYHGQPMARHLPLPIDAEHFDRWLALFAQTAGGVSATRSGALHLIVPSHSREP